MNPELIKSWLVDLIKANQVVNVAGRIYPDEAPDGTVNPCIVYQYLGADFQVNMDSVLDDTDHIIQIRIYADTRQAADSLRGDLAEHLLAVCGRELAPGVKFTDTSISAFNDVHDPDDGSYGALFVWSASHD